MKPTVLNTNLVPEEHLAPIIGLCQLIQGPGNHGTMPRDKVLALGPRLEAIINQHELSIDRELLSACPKLKIVANVAMGYNNFDQDAMREHSVIGTNTPDVFTEATAEHTMALLLAVARRVVELDNYTRSGSWPGDGFQPGRWDGTLLNGKTLGIVGYGKIGQAVAKRADAFGLKVVYVERGDAQKGTALTLSELLKVSDFVTLHVPLTPETTNLLNSARLSEMKPGAFLINMSRGGVVDDTALADAVSNGHLRGAALDVFDGEPNLLPRLLELKQIVLSPHTGGGTHESRRAARLCAASNVAAVLRGLPPLNPVVA